MKKYDHGGNIHKVIRGASGKPQKIYDFSANINPLGPPEWMRPLISRSLENLVHYPDPEYRSFVKAISQHTELSEKQIAVGNGTTELLYTYLRVSPCKRVVIPVPSYVDYARAAEIAGKSIITVSLDEKEGFVPNLDKLADIIMEGDLVIVATPNNPTGIHTDRNGLLELINDFKSSEFLIDEAFLDFIEGGRSLGGCAPNISTLNSMTKFYGIPGLRIGYGTFPGKICTLIKDNMPPWTVNSLAAEVGAKALHDVKYKVKSRLFCSKLREDLRAGLTAFKQLQVFPSEANYFFVKLQKGTTSSLADHCLLNGIMIRRCGNYLGLENGDSFFRVAVRTAKENKKLLEVFKSYFSKENNPQKTRKKARSIMFQGTCSDAGKSIITAAFCRILFQDGYHVAPFKAQNMSLNSFVTLQGDEMGRAQVVQAQAARLDPDCRMNPILLKPNSDTGSQIIVSGKPVGNMSVNAYNAFKPKVWNTVCNSFDSLALEYDVVVLEGAGSPGEVNLKADDIVNMKMAEYSASPVILVGDIDRGGVYSSFVGIMEVLAEWERELVAGFLVNKFRGQASLLDSAHEYVKFHTGREVVGVVPYLSNLGIPEEDSVSFKKGSFNKSHQGEGVEITVINLPHISNFTDVEPFLDEPDVSLRVVDKVSDIGSPDAIVLPGTKNVIYDLEFILSNGFDHEIKRCEQAGTQLVGVCGGYQMLGKTIKDPYQIESPLGQIDGLGYLPLETIIEAEKNLLRKSGKHIVSGQQIFGYEIHHGISSPTSEPLLLFEDGTVCGSANTNSQIWGCYLHGIFESDQFRRWFIDELRKKKGLQPVGKVLAKYDLEAAFDKLAATVRENVDIPKLYELMGL